MIPFPKTDGLFVRDPDNPKRVTTEHRHPVYSQLKGWWIEEKVDGTNCRIIIHPGEPNRCDVRGRSDAADLSKPLREALEFAAHDAHVSGEWRAFAEGDKPACIYGEGIGLGVNGNPYGLDRCYFVAFDIKVGEHPERGWLAPETVNHTVRAMGLIPAPVIWRNGTLGDAVQAGRGGWRTQLPIVPEDSEAQAEGVVAKARVPLYDARGKLIRLKLKPSNAPTLGAA
jgi:hypothetical protein